MKMTADIAMQDLLKAWKKTQKERKEIIQKEYIDELRDELIHYQNEEFIEDIVKILSDFEYEKD